MHCITIDDDAVTRRLISEYISRTDFLIDMASFDNSFDALNYLQSENSVELIFLDIRMPQMTGFEFLETLDRQPQIIIMSGSADYALKAFDFGATDYLLKPIPYARFYRGVTKALRWMQPPTENEELFLKKNNSLVRVPYSSIIWIESMENYVNLYTDTERFSLHFTLKATEMHLPQSLFRRIHRSFMVNINRIESIEQEEVMVKRNGELKALPIGKSYRDNLLRALRQMLGQ